MRRRRRRIEFGNGLSHIDKPSAPEAQEDGSWDLALNAPRAVPTYFRSTKPRATPGPLLLVRVRVPVADVTRKRAERTGQRGSNAGARTEFRDLLLTFPSPAVGCHSTLWASRGLHGAELRVLCAGAYRSGTRHSSDRVVVRVSDV